MEQEKRKRAAWRFAPKFLNRLQRFAAQQELRTTQTAVIEAAVTEYMDRKEDPKRALRR